MVLNEADRISPAVPRGCTQQRMPLVLSTTAAVLDASVPQGRGADGVDAMA
jgi:hypothetical protein